MSPPDYADFSVDELIAASDALGDRTDGVADRLNRITGRAGDARLGIEVAVNVHGRLTALELSDAALRLGSGRLAEEIFRLAAAASRAALAEGDALLREAGGDEVAELLELAGAPPVPHQVQQAVTPQPDEEDNSQVESWALPR